MTKKEKNLTERYELELKKLSSEILQHQAKEGKLNVLSDIKSMIAAHKLKLNNI